MFETLPKKPTNVIVELISNSWNSDANEVTIDTSKEIIAIFDNGHGMRDDVVVNNYSLFNDSLSIFSYA